MYRSLLTCVLNVGKETYKRDLLILFLIYLGKMRVSTALRYGEATISGLLIVIGLFCRVSSLL